MTSLDVSVNSPQSEYNWICSNLKRESNSPNGESQILRFGFCFISVPIRFLLCQIKFSHFDLSLKRGKKVNFRVSKFDLNLTVWFENISCLDYSMGKEEKSDLDRLTEGQEGREILIVATWLRK